LGYHFATTRKGRLTRWPREKSLDKLKDTIRAKTKRTNGHSLRVIIVDVNQTLIGWFGYFKHSCVSTFKPLDGWIRMRLRSVLRYRIGRKGRGRGADHQRYPNVFFANSGYFSLEAAHRMACQSPSG